MGTQGESATALEVPDKNDDALLNMNDTGSLISEPNSSGSSCPSLEMTSGHPRRHTSLMSKGGFGTAKSDDWREYASYNWRALHEWMDNLFKEGLNGFIKFREYEGMTVITCADSPPTGCSHGGMDEIGLEKCSQVHTLTKTGHFGQGIYVSLIALSNRHSGMHAKEGMLIMTKQYHEYPHEANISTKRLFDDAEEWRFQTLRKKLLNYFHHLVLEVNEPIENMVCQGKAALKGKYGVIDFDDPYPISGTVIEQTTASKFNDKDKELLAEEISYLYKLNDSQHFRFQWKEGGPWEEMKQRDYLHAKSKTTVELYISADGAPCRLYQQNFM